MKTIARCFDLNQALQLKLVLDAAGIASFIPDEVTAAIAPFNFFTPSGVRLQVDDADLDRAQEILNEVPNFSASSQQHEEE